ncbi:TetR/AcrR family transcriptional regulator [Microbispora sp. NPDC004025]
MPRSSEQARRRLQQAALDLYRENGFDRTTTAEIAARAGVTERTYFRHFPDKREVLFDGEDALRVTLISGVAEAPATLPPLPALLWALRSATSLLENNRAFSEPRQRVIDTTPALRERELTKVASLAADLTEALRRRGVPDRTAALAAQTGMVAFRQAFGAWISDPAPGLDALLHQAFDDLRTLTTAR